MEWDSEAQDVALALGELRASPTRLQRLANVALKHLGGVDVTVEPREDSRVAIILPEAWAHLFLAHLTAQAEQVHERLRQAMWKARVKDSRLSAEIEAAGKQWEEQQTRIQERYRQLVAQGLSKREAIRRIKKDSHGQLTATIVQSVVEGADHKKKRVRQERDQRILALRAQGLKIREIAGQVGTTQELVKWILRKGRERHAKTDRR